MFPILKNNNLNNHMANSDTFFKKTDYITFNFIL